MATPLFFLHRLACVPWRHGLVHNSGSFEGRGTSSRREQGLLHKRLDRLNTNVESFGGRGTLRDLLIGVASTVSVLVWAAAAVVFARTPTIHDDAPQMFGEPFAHGVIHMPIS